MVRTAIKTKLEPQKTIKRCQSRTIHYVWLIGYECANPDCKNGMDIEGHHVTPLSKGGADKYWNIISLCRGCHRNNKLHSKYEQDKIKLLTWKCYQELKIFGFCLDENEMDFSNRMLLAMKIAKKRNPKIIPDLVTEN